MRYRASSSTICVRLRPRVRQVCSRIRVLNVSSWRNPPLAPVIRDAEAQEVTLLWSRYRALRLVDRQPQLRGQEPAHRGHDPFAGAVTANIDVAVVRVPAESVATPRQLLIEIVEHGVAQEGRERTALRGLRDTPAT